MLPSTFQPTSPAPPEHVIGEFLRAMRDGMADASNTTPSAALIGKADHDPTCRGALIGVLGECRDLLNRLLEPSGVNLDADQHARVCGPVLFQRFFAREPIRDQLIAQLIATWSADRSAGVTADSTHQGTPVFARLAKPALEIGPA